MSVYNRSTPHDKLNAFVYGVGVQMTAGSGANLALVYTLGVSIKSKKHPNLSFDMYLDIDMAMSGGFSENISFGYPFILEQENETHI